MTDDDNAPLEIARYELNYRREKQWKIFSWIATILVAVISGIVALAGKAEWAPSYWQKGAMSVALVVITIYACTWTSENIKFENQAHKRILTYVKDETILAAPGEFCLGYNNTVILLLIAALAAIWIGE
jgi:hypothetical protein